MVTGRAHGNHRKKQPTTGEDHRKRKDTKKDEGHPVKQTKQIQQLDDHILDLMVAESGASVGRRTSFTIEQIKQEKLENPFSRLHKDAVNGLAKLSKKKKHGAVRVYVTGLLPYADKDTGRVYCGYHKITERCGVEGVGPALDDLEREALIRTWEYRTNASGEFKTFRNIEILHLAYLKLSREVYKRTEAYQQNMKRIEEQKKKHGKHISRSESRIYDEDQHISRSQFELTQSESGIILNYKDNTKFERDTRLIDDQSISQISEKPSSPRKKEKGSSRSQLKYLLLAEHKKARPNELPLDPTRDAPGIAATLAALKEMEGDKKELVRMLVKYGVAMMPEPLEAIHGGNYKKWVDSEEFAQWLEDEKYRKQKDEEKKEREKRKEAEVLNMERLRQLKEEEKKRLEQLEDEKRIASGGCPKTKERWFDFQNPELDPICKQCQKDHPDTFIKCAEDAGVW